MKDPLTQVPEAHLILNGPISGKCIAAGLSSFREACQFVRDLPYGELAAKEHWANTLEENMGTSSTKHAFLKALADEIGLEIELILGIYCMTEQNTPGVGAVLSKYRMQSIPEAHCYLRYKGIRLDFTRNYFDNDFMEPILSFIHEEPIKSDHAPSYKKALHQKVIRERFGEDRFAHIWQIRERCIAALEN